MPSSPRRMMLHGRLIAMPSYRHPRVLPEMLNQRSYRRFETGKPRQRLSLQVFRRHLVRQMQLVLQRKIAMHLR